MIVTFYSYKGGTGRTQLLSNLAAYFCFYQDKKVLMIDWDLEAPGLHFYFNKDNLKHKGLLDLMSHYCGIMEQEVTVPEDKIEQEFKENLPTYIKKNIEVSESGKGRIDLMPAGYYDDTYTHKANHFDWVKFYESLDGGFFIELLKKYLKAQDYDYIFIDSRTGISDYSGICNIQMPDANVVVIAPTDQNVKGCKRVIKRITEAEYVKDQQQRYPIIIPILSRLDPSNNEQRGIWIKKFRTEFRPHIDQLIKLSVNLLPNKKHREIITDDIVEEYIKTTLIEYQTDISYGEKILFGKKRKDIEITTIEEQFVGIAGFIEAFKDYPFVEFLPLPFSFSQMTELFKKSLKITENEYNTFYYAIFLNSSGDLSAAKKYYEKSFKLTDNVNLKYKIQNNLAVILKETDKFDEAEKIYVSLLDTKNSADVLRNLANLYFETNKFDKAEFYYNKSLSNYRKHAEQDSSFLVDLAEILTNIGRFYNVLNRFEKAEQVYQEALEIRRQLVQVNRQLYLPSIAGTLNNLAILYQDKKEFTKAEQAFQEGLGIYRQLSQINPQTYLNSLAMTLNNLGILQRDKNEFRKAAASYEEALEIYKQLAQINPKVYLSDVAMTLNNLANLYYVREEFVESEQAFLEALSIRRKLAEVNPQTYLPDVAITLNNIGSLNRAKKEFTNAEQAYKEAMQIRQKFAESIPHVYLPNLAETKINMSMLYCYDYPQKEKSISLAVEVIKIATQYHHIPIVLQYAKSAIRVLKDWGIEDVDAYLQENTTIT